MSERRSVVADPSVMRRRQLSGAIGRATLGVRKFSGLLEQARSKDDLQQRAYALRHLEWCLERLDACRAEWDRRGYVVGVRSEVP